MQKKIIVSTMLSVIVILLALWVVSNLTVNDSIRHSLSERTSVAGILANYMDSLLQNNLTRLYDVSLSGAIDLDDGDWGPETSALKTAYQYSIFTDGIFLLDLQGNIVFTYPASQMRKRNLMNISYVKQTIEGKKAVISNIYTEERTNRKLIFVLVPLRDREGATIGAVGGEINPTNYLLTNVIKAIPASGETFIELVDSNGVVIASNNPVRVFQCSDRNRVLGGLIASRRTGVMECHRCHDSDGHPPDAEQQRTTDMLAFAPLTEAPWGITVREPEKRVFAPSLDLKKKFVLLGVVTSGTALLLALGMSKSIVNPIKSLIAAANKIADGNLSDRVTTHSPDEIGVLSSRFERMRQKLSDTQQALQEYNMELERRVSARTDELQRSRQSLSALLQKVIRAQEEERKRIARELHDETSQSIAALGMSIEVAAMALKDNELSVEGIYELKGKVSQLLEGISRLIQDLRPPVLDDLGLESAVRWLLERHIAERGISYEMRCSEEFHRLMASSEHVMDEKVMLALFRVIQETIINVSKHAEASHVVASLSCEESCIMVTVEDDGEGFDMEKVMGVPDAATHAGFGIMGLKERVSLLDGTVCIRSTPGMGTAVAISIPLSSLGVSDV